MEPKNNYVGLSMHRRRALSGNEGTKEKEETSRIWFILNNKDGIVRTPR